MRQWIAAPLVDAAAIDARLEAVDRLVSERGQRRALAERLSEVGDLERSMARICCRRATARDLAGLGRSLAVVPAVVEITSNLDCELLQQLVSEDETPSTIELVDLLGRALVDEPPTSIGEGGMFRSGYDGELDRFREVSTDGKNWVARLQSQERERTGITSLKVGFNQVFGYYIEVSKPNLDRVPEDYSRKQTLANAERFVTPELKEHEAQILEAQERIQEIELSLFVDLRDRTAGWSAEVQRCAGTLARIDVLCSLAEVAETESWVRPQVDESQSLEIEAGRHPVVERQLREGNFVPNDVALDVDGDQILVITGPNMAGKSTIIRQIGLAVVLAQMGSFVPARRARIGVVDRLFTRVGASDNLARGESTFMVEMIEASTILNNVTHRSLVLIDELGRGTSTFDGLSIAWAIVEHLHDGPVHPRALFATHYHELTELEQTLARVRNCNVQVREESDHIVFLHRMAVGPCDRSYGINVAQMAGMPGEVVARAQEILADLEQGRGGDTSDRSQNDRSQNDRSRADERRQMDLFGRSSHGEQIVAEIMSIDVSATTPLEALCKLDEWKRRFAAAESPPAPDKE